MGLVAAWELIALDDQGDGTHRCTAVAKVDGRDHLRLVTTTVELSDAEAAALRAEGIKGPFDRRPA